MIYFPNIIIFVLSILDSKRARLEPIPAANLDADDPIEDDVNILFSISVISLTGRKSVNGRYTYWLRLNS